MVILFQPQLSNLEDKRSTVAQLALQRATEKAALEGYYTQEIIDEMYSILEMVGYTRDDVVLDLTSEEVFRGEYIKGTVKVPNQYQYILLTNLLDSDKTTDESYHVHFSSRMSEHVN